jgi:hypothetical protein
VEEEEATNKDGRGGSIVEEEHQVVGCSLVPPMWLVVEYAIHPRREKPHACVGSGDGNQSVASAACNRWMHGIWSFGSKIFFALFNLSSFRGCLQSQNKIN